MSLPKLLTFINDIYHHIYIYKCIIFTSDHNLELVDNLNKNDFPSMIVDESNIEGLSLFDERIRIYIVPLNMKDRFYSLTKEYINDFTVVINTTDQEIEKSWFNKLTHHYLMKI